MPFLPVPETPYDGVIDHTTDAHNSAISPLAHAFNLHDHDPGDSIAPGSYGRSIPGWGPTNTLYTAHGPGSGGSDWNSTYNGQAAIPGDPTETAVSPINGSVLTQSAATSAMSASDGIQAHIQRLYGALALLKGWTALAPVNWWDPVSLALVNPGTAQAGSVLVDASHSVSAGQLISTVPTGTAPLVVTSTTEVLNLNAAMVAGHPYTLTYGTTGDAGNILGLNTAGLFDALALASAGYPIGGSYTFTATPVTIADDLMNLYYMFWKWAVAWDPTSTTFNDFPTALTAGVAINAEATPHAGQTTLVQGTGITLTRGVGASAGQITVATAATTGGALVLGTRSLAVSASISPTDAEVVATAAAITLTLPAISAVVAGQYFVIVNASSGSITLAVSGTDHFFTAGGLVTTETLTTATVTHVYVANGNWMIK